jgi:hypothetical protein
MSREVFGTHSQRVSLSLIGRLAEDARRWKGNKASYAAKHMWLSKHYSKGNTCEDCGTNKASRLEWANVSGEYLRERSDYKVLCPSCHRLMDNPRGWCRSGHEMTPQNTYISKERWHKCRECRKLSQRRYMEKRNAKTD